MYKRQEKIKAAVGVFAEKDDFKSGMKERVGDGKLIIIISITVSGLLNSRINGNGKGKGGGL